MCICFGFSKKIKKSQLHFFKRPPINLHISYLPYNKGSDPNFWSFIHNTPKGVTIHEMNSEIDDGPIILRKKINFKNDEKLTLNKSYKKLKKAVEDLLKKNFNKILSRKYKTFKPTEYGSENFNKNFPFSIKNIYNLSIQDVRIKYNLFLNKKNKIFDYVNNHFNNYANYKSEYKAVNWGSLKSQHLRYEKLIATCIINKQNKMTVLDVGSGLSGFYGFIKKKNLNWKYVGCEMNSKLVKRSQKKFKKIKIINTNFLTHNFKKKYDFIISSGLFYLLNDINIVKKLIIKMYDLSKFGIAFNSLSSWSDKKNPKNLYLDPLLIIHFCSTFSKKIVFFHDYHKGDFTLIIMKK